MKTWMKVLMWLGLGGGVGFFAGYQVGAGKTQKAYEDGIADGYSDGLKAYRPIAVQNTIKEYRGGDFDGDSVQVTTEEEVEMPEETPVIGDEEEIEEIPELHPQHLIPEQISEEEYYSNPWGFDQESLYFYELDEVLYNRETKKAIKDKDAMDQVIGIGMTFNFYKKDGEVLDAIFVKNSTMGVIFRIDRLEASYMDEIVGANAPEYEEDEEEDFN